MGMTISNKILARHMGRDEVKPGQIFVADLDLVLANDATLPIAIDEFSRLNASTVFDRE